MFTSFDTLNEILSAPGMRKWFHFLFAEEHLALFPGESWDQPLRLAAFRGRTTWGSNLQELAEQIVDTANLVLELQAGKRQCLHLHDWKLWEPEENADLQDPEQTFVIAPSAVEGEGLLKPALIICPGGGYEFVSFHNEGTPVQIVAEKRGYVPFMVRYRVAPSRYPKPQMDLLETIRYVRDHAAKYHVDPGRIGIIGFPTGGHGCGLAYGNSAWRWSVDMFSFLERHL